MSADKQTRHNKTRQPRSDFQRLSRRFMSGLLRSLFLINKPTRAGQAGFVLPTTVLLLLIVTLTVGAMSYRTFSRTTQTMAYRDQQIVDSIAAPAIDRAKAKIEFLFTEDASVTDKKPPSSGDLLTALAEPAGGAADDIYTIKNETRIDINGDSTKDNAWSFEEGGTKIIYSIILDDSVDLDGDISTDTDIVSIDKGSDLDKATQLIVRNGPVDTTTPTGSCPIERLAGNGWQVSGARLAKNIQVNVLAIKNPGTPSETVSASEYQQVRTATRGNRWGAWFRYDLDATPGEPFRWNGAMHTEGNMIANTGFIAYMVSSPSSCIYDKDASIIELKGDENPPFLGQLISGSIVDNAFANGAVFHTDTTAKDNSYANAGDELITSKDTIKDGATSVADIFQDPIQIFTEDKFSHINSSAWERDTAKWNSSTNTYGVNRVRNDTSQAARPFLDDGYRADNRYGPKPVYNKENSFSKLNDTSITPKKSGDSIANTAANSVLINNTVGTEEIGLDGYWERSAVAKGLRLVVGQRLELGNTFGWRGNNDPLYPPNSSFDRMKSQEAPNLYLKGVNEALQMRSLRDNLAAVQSMAVYHAADPTTLGKYPLACIASVVHPGTLETIKSSRTFDKYDHISPAKWEADFFTGHGTNGMEFAFPTNLYSGATKNTHGSLSLEWKNALENLANFAGDPAGGAPSFPAIQGQVGISNAVVHPYPYMAMWGDFSILRRIFNTYSATDTLSTADQSTIHTAACTLGMLAYNIEAVREEFKGILAASELQALGNNLKSLSYSPMTTDEWIARLYTSYKLPLSDGIPGTNISANERKNLRNALTIAKLYQIERDRAFGFVSAANAKGIASTSMNPTASPSSGYSASDRKYTGVSNIGCDPAIFGAISEDAKIGLGRALCSTAQGPKYPSLYYVFPRGNHDQTGAGDNQQPTGTEDFFVEGGATFKYMLSSSVNPEGAGNTYKAVTVSTIASTINSRTPNDSTWTMPKKAVTVTGSTVVNEKPDFNSFSAPDAAPSTSYAYSSPGVSTIPNEEDKSLSGNVVAVQDDSSYKFYQTAVLDTAIMDGRELLNVRLMNLDIDLLTDMSSTVGGKAWIPGDSGIVYTFREDAVREDAIVRPYFSSLDNNPSNAWDSCKTVAKLTAGDCHMKLDPLGTPYDPPLNNATGISPKPVDMYPDPDRRAHGFRLINGKTLNRPNVSPGEAVAGMTFVTDNTVYIKGDFNLHAKKATNSTEKAALESNLIEEFKGTGKLLGTAFASISAANEADARALFYGRDKLSLDDKFADPNKDNWRPVEIFADAITILSDTFIDGSLQDYYTVPTKESVGDPRQNSSYLNANRPDVPTSGARKDKHGSASWFHEADPSLDLALSSTFPFDRSDTPIVVGRNGMLYKAVGYTGPPFVKFPEAVSDTSGNISFYARNASDSKFFYQKRQYQQPSPRRVGEGVEAPVRINALLIAGIVPARKGQAYGGIHNFPRLLEYWSKRPGGGGQENRALVISGGFFQLNFSSQAVAPFDQDAWEPGAVPFVGTTEHIEVNDTPLNPMATKRKTGNQYLSNFYYAPPQRIWGYDPALQYASAGPIAQRFVRVDRPRSEYYREMPVDDPYVQLLCKAPQGANGKC